MSDAIEIMASLPPEHLIDLKTIYALIRVTAEGSGGDDSEMKFLSVSKDTLWPSVLKKAEPEIITTNIDGKYHRADVKGGSYYLYSEYESPYSIIEWMTELRTL